MKSRRLAFTLVVFAIAALVIYAMATRDGAIPSTSTPTPTLTPDDVAIEAPDGVAGQVPAGGGKPAVAPTVDDNVAANAQADVDGDAESETDADVAGAQPGDADGVAAADGASAEPPAELATATMRFQAAVIPAEDTARSSLGSTDSDSGFKIAVELTPWGAGIRSIHLTDYDTTVHSGVHYAVQHIGRMQLPGGKQASYFPFAAKVITIDGQNVDLQGKRWRLLEEGVYQLDIVDANDDNRSILRLTRRYYIDGANGPYDIRCDQSIANLTSIPLKVVWRQNVFADPPPDEASYLGDQRYVIAGYHDIDYDPNRQFVDIRETLTRRDKVHGPARTALLDAEYARGSAIGRLAIHDVPPVWPNDDLPESSELVWFGAVNRYFGTVVHRPISADQAEAGMATPRLDERFAKVGMEIIRPAIEATDADDEEAAPAAEKVDPAKAEYELVYLLDSKPLVIAPGTTEELNLSMYAGPRKPEVFKAEPYQTLGFPNLIIYNLGGCCAMFTFQWVAKGLLGFMRFIHAITFDWGIAIIVLVVVVRLVLHPITKKAQVKLSRFSKKLQELQPEMEKIKKKYGDEQQRVLQEQQRLFREKKINPASGALGCAPMLLQTPIWIALYAMLYFAIELRHVDAFWGVFQAISGGQWGFLADLSSPDALFRFSDKPIKFNLLIFHLDFSALNILPLLWGVVMFFQMKLMTPPTTTDQQKQAQTIQRVMMLMFPFFLYGAPSGLTLYMLASTGASMLDSYYVRKHIKKLEAEGVDPEKEETWIGRMIGKVTGPARAAMAERMQQVAKAAEERQRGQQQRDTDQRRQRGKRKK